MPLYAVKRLRRKKTAHGRVTLSYEEWTELVQYFLHFPITLGPFVVRRIRSYRRGTREACSEVLKSGQFDSLRRALAVYSKWSGEQVTAEAERALMGEALEYTIMLALGGKDSFRSPSAIEKLKSKLKLAKDQLHERFAEERQKPSERLKDALLGHEEVLEALSNAIARVRRPPRVLAELKEFVEEQRGKLETLIQEARARELLEYWVDRRGNIESPDHTSNA